MKKHVVLLTNGSHDSKALANLLVKSGLNLTHIFVQKRMLALPPEPRGIKGILKQMLGKKIVKKIQELRIPAEAKRIHALEQQLQEAASKQVAAFIEKQKLPFDFPKGPAYMEVPVLNSPEVVEVLKTAVPDLAVVLGTSILKAPVFEVPTIGTINAHTSILPEYRGTRVEFWQCYYNDFEHTGITIHFIDKNVDTGNVLFQVRTEGHDKIDPFELRAKNMIAILNNYPKVVKQILKGEIEPWQQRQSTMPTYRSKDMTLENKIELYNRIYP